MKILLISDIHGNYPALEAITQTLGDSFDLILNGGDTTVYAPFPNETIDWLRAHNSYSIIGNTDSHIRALLKGKTFKKPRKPDKRIMYGWTAAELSDTNKAWLSSQPLEREIRLQQHCSKLGQNISLGMFHGSPADPDEFLFANTPDCRFREFTRTFPHDIITVGHSHSPFHKHIGGVHFINPGSVGRMFDGKPSASCAVLTVNSSRIKVKLHRIDYSIETVIKELKRLRFPAIYQEMYRIGRKLN